METPRKFIIAELSIRKLGSSSMLIILIIIIGIISTDEDPSLRNEGSAIINLRGVSTKLNKYIVFIMQTYTRNLSNVNSQAIMNAGYSNVRILQNSNDNVISQLQFAGLVRV